MRLIAPQYVRPFVKRQKNDAADAEAIVVAAQRPETRFVTPKTVTPRGRRSIPEGSWLAKMLGKKPRMLVAIALANKMTRMIWAMLIEEEDYRDPARAAAA